MSSIEDEELRRRKLEEALEVKSLRRIISAYLKYISVLSRTHQSALYIILCLRLSLCMIVLFIYWSEMCFHLLPSVNALYSTLYLLQRVTSWILELVKKIGLVLF